MDLNIKDFPTLVRDQVTAIQARAAGLVDFSIGALTRAIVESNASVVQWIQQLIVNLLATTRAATSSGADLDSWMSDFSFYRLSAVQATGLVTFSRFTATNSALILIGSVVASSDGSQLYSVTIDTTNTLYNAILNGYLVPSGTTSATVPVSANTAGSAGNAQVGTITVIVGSISGIDTVNNTSAFVNGVDQEGDDAFRRRFVLWIASLSKSTKAAIGSAIMSLQQGVSYTLTENKDINGATVAGYFTAVIDDGSGNPSSTFLSSAANAIEAVRPFTVTYGVFGPQIVTANVSMTLTVDSSVSKPTVVALVTSALQAYIAGLTLGQLLPFTQLAAVAYGASPYVQNVSSVTLNSGTADLAATSRQVIRSGTINVS
ncbi:baseplate J/gp47 family protein [Chromobacterium haemolyticum]|uniref:Baseplate protein n=1 Tax=Chromobacterium haemolyticum TaxID=394935 RepID=A0A1W0D5T0_9NEIS|nr:baseplate J/gp47 family protein [Chromobacterium haemolyticum]OQS42346.1 baseplate protein [Chromobacterium haemolyticum]